MDYLPHFGYNKNLPENTKTVLFSHFLMPDIKKNFRQT